MSIEIRGHSGLSMEVLRRPFTPVETSILHFVSALAGEQVGVPRKIQWKQIEIATGMSDTGIQLSGQRLVRDGVLKRELVGSTGTRGARRIPQVLSVCGKTSEWKNRAPRHRGIQDVVADHQLVISYGAQYRTDCPRCGHSESMVLYPERASVTCPICKIEAEGEAAWEVVYSFFKEGASEKSKARIRG